LTLRDCVHACAAVLALVLGAGPAAAVVAVEQAPKSPIEGPTWRLTRLGDKEGEALRGTSRAPTLRFASGQVEGFSGCNNFGGGYRLEPGRVVIDALRSTMMACVGDSMAIEAAFMHALAGTLAYRVDAGALTLTPGSGDALVFVAEAAPQLAGVTWNVTGYNNGRQAVVSPMVGSALALTFGEGVVRGQAGCNAFHASAQVEGERIHIGAPVATRKTCPGEGLMAQERAFLAALQTAKRWLIQDGRLELRSAGGERVLTARTGEK
jgi:heat shock protein HslJ